MIKHPPTPEEIRRLRSWRTQKEMAELAGLVHRERWAEYESGAVVPPRGRWEMILLRTDKHPTHRLVKR